MTKSRLRSGLRRVVLAAGMATMLLGVLGLSTQLTGHRLVGVAHAAAPVCNEYTGAGCDHNDPYQTTNLEGVYCAGGSGSSFYVAATANVYNTAGAYGGYVQVWWSNTCQTNWARIVPQAPVVIPPSDTGCFAVKSEVFTVDGRSDPFQYGSCVPSWTNMLWAHSVKAWAQGWVYTDYADFTGTTVEV